jgi:hypothetical protein
LHKSPLLSESDGEVEEAKKTPPRRKKGSGAPVKIDLPASHVPEDGEEGEEEIPKEPLKTLVAALFLATGFVATTSSLAVTHESVPDIGNSYRTPVQSSQVVLRIRDILVRIPDSYF